MSPSSGSTLPIAIAILAATSLAAVPARAAGSVIKNPRQHIDYRLEIEPHADFVFFRYRLDGFRDNGISRGGFGDPEFGGGLRATIEVADPAFIPKLNNTVGVTFGVDVTGCPSYCDSHVHIRMPVGIQWTFYVTREFNAFADLGFMLHIAAAGGRGGVYPDFFGMAGARYLFSDKTAFTLRIGYPFVSLGVSFFAG